MFFSHRALMLAAFGSGATQFITYGVGNFATLFLMREKGMTLGQVAVWYALVVGIGMSGGIFVSGRVIDRFTRRSKQAYALVPAISLVLAIPFYLAFVWAPTWQLALLFLIGPTFLNYFYLSSSVALVQEEVRPDQRVMSGALLLLVMNFIGLGLGPTYVGAASDFFRASHLPSRASARALHACAVLRPRHRAVPLARARPARAKPSQTECHDDLVSSSDARGRLLCFVAASPSFAAPTPLVDAPAGQLQGQMDGAIRVFKGIPYALPPLGLRALESAGADAALGGRQSRDRVRTCLPAARIARSEYLSGRSGPMSEDCLTLNIWAPADARNAPVFFWIHGGALVGGCEQRGALRRRKAGRARHCRGHDQLSAGRAGLAGASRAQRRVAAPHLRQLRSARSDRGAALGEAQYRRLRRRCFECHHRGQIRGRPQRHVSAGVARGARPVRESHRGKRLHGLHAGCSKKRKYGQQSPRKTQACISRLRCMRRTSPHCARWMRATLANAAPAAGFAPFGAVDGHILPQQLVEIFDKGEQAPVPLLAGFNAGEIRSLRILAPPPPANAAAYESTIRDRYRDLADEFLRLYPSTNMQESIWATTRDALYGWTAERLVKKQTAIGQPAFLYFFDHGYPAEDDAGYHAFHASELPFVFGNTDRTPPLWPKIPTTAAGGAALRCDGRLLDELCAHGPSAGGERAGLAGL